MRPGEEGDVAALIHRATNGWYRKKLGYEIFTCTAEDCRLFPETYEALDPGCCLVAETEDGALAGCCFYHPRESHVGLGIMAVSPDHAGNGVARTLLDEVIKKAEDRPVRLVSSAMNLDSFSLYTRAGFGPVAVYHDLVIPKEKLPIPPPAGAGSVRPATVNHLFAMADLEQEISGILRGKDLAHFIKNPGGRWTTFVHLDSSGKIDGWLASIDHPACRMIGPGVMRDEIAAMALIHAQLSVPREGDPVFLVAAHESDMIAELYRWGARNVELHFAQVRGGYMQPQGVVMPSFLPESG